MGVYNIIEQIITQVFSEMWLTILTTSQYIFILGFNKLLTLNY